MDVLEKESKIYEFGYLLKADLKEEEILDFSEKLRKKITEKKGLILTEGKTKKITLAYPISKETMAVFNWVKFTINPNSIKELEEYLKKESLVLRFLTVKSEKEEVASKPTIKKIRKIKKPEEISEITPITKTPELPLLEKPEKSIKEPEIEPEEKPKEQKIKEEEIDKKIEELLGEN